MKKIAKTFGAVRIVFFVPEESLCPEMEQKWGLICICKKAEAPNQTVFMMFININNFFGYTVLIRNIFNCPKMLKTHP